MNAAIAALLGLLVVACSSTSSPQQAARVELLVTFGGDPPVEVTGEPTIAAASQRLLVETRSNTITVFLSLPDPVPSSLLVGASASGASLWAQEDGSSPLVASRGMITNSDGTLLLIDVEKDLDAAGESLHVTGEAQLSGAR